MAVNLLKNRLLDISVQSLDTGSATIDSLVLTDSISVGDSTSKTTMDNDDFQILLNNATCARITATDGGSSGNMFLQAGNAGDNSSYVKFTNIDGSGVGVQVIPATGAFSCASFSASATGNAPNVISLNANGGINETILIRSQQGTSVGAVAISASAGGIQVDANQALALVGGTGVSCTATTGNTDIVSSAGDVSLTATGGSVSVSATEDAGNAILINANGGVNETVVLSSTQGTGAGAVQIASSAGGVQVSANQALALSGATVGVTGNCTFNSGLVTTYGGVINGSTDLDQSQSGAILPFNLTGVYNINLPAVAGNGGVHYYLAVQTSIGDAVTIVAPANTLYGSVVGSTNVSGSAQTNLVVTGGSAVAGDFIELRCNGTNWYARAQTTGIGAMAFS